MERNEAEAEAAEQAAKAARATASQRRVGLQFFDVKAPFTGVVGEFLVRIGDFVTASTPLTSLTQAEALEVRTTVPADRARAIRVGTPVEILDSRGEVVLTAPVYFVAAEAAPETQLVDVLALLGNSAGFRPREVVRVRIVYSSQRTLQVPAMAIVRQSGQAFVFAVAEKDQKLTVARRPITLGALGERAFQVEAGLQVGDRIAVSSLQALSDGAAILIKPAPGETAKTGSAAPPEAGK